MLRPQDIRLFEVFQEATSWETGGEVVLRSGGDTGRVFFAGGRIAWVVVSTISRTFTEYLAEHSSIDGEEIREVFEECKRTGKNFGETIVDWGLLDEKTLRLLLLQHISECMLEIFSWPEVESMFMPEQRTYKGSLTFEFVEILQTALILDTEKRLPFSDMKVHEIMMELGAHMAEKKVSHDGQPDAKDEAKAPAEPSVSASPEDRDVPPPAAPARQRRRGLVALVVIVLVLAVGALGYVYRQRLAALLGFATAPEPAKKGLDTVAAGPVSPGASDNGGLATTAMAGAGGVDAGMSREEPAAKGADAPADAHVDEQGATSGEPAGPPGTQERVAGSEAPDADDAPALAPVEPEGIVYGWPGEGTGSIRVTSRPRRAPIFLDGVFTGHLTPHTLRQVPAGREHLVMLEKRRHLPSHRKVRVRRGKRATVKLRLKRSRRRPQGETRVRILSQPQGADIWLDGEKTGETTPADVALRNSSATKLELRLEGSKPWKRTVRPTPKQTITIFARLDPV